MSILRPSLLGFISLCLASTIQANTVHTTVYGEHGEFLGWVYFIDTHWGLLIQPNLSKLPPNSMHGFHIHEKGSCDPHSMAPYNPDQPPTPPGAFLSAAGHLDPYHTGKHRGPLGNGHLGDLPALITNNYGEAYGWLIAPRLRTWDIVGHALMIHAGGDNYSDDPQPLGGGGPRIGCGVIRDYRPNNSNWKY